MACLDIFPMTVPVFWKKWLLQKKTIVFPYPDVYYAVYQNICKSITLKNQAYIFATAFEIIISQRLSNW
jgi:hypothetical protein